MGDGMRRVVTVDADWESDYMRSPQFELGTFPAYAPSAHTVDIWRPSELPAECRNFLPFVKEYRKQEL